MTRPLSPEDRVAARLARVPHPTLDPARKAEIEARVLAHAAHIHAQRDRRRRSLGITRWAAVACLALALLAVILTASGLASGPDAPRAIADTSEPQTITLTDSVTVRNSGSTTLIVMPLSP